MVNLREKLVGILWLWTEKMRGVAHAGAQRGEGSEPGVSTSPGDASRLAGCVLARTHVALRVQRPRWTGAGDPHRVSTVASPIHSFLFFAKYFQNLN